MINNIKTLQSRSQHILNELHEASFELYLTGSRFFGNAELTADYDFFTEDTQATRDWLQKSGFETNVASHYSEDRLVTAVYSIPAIRIHDGEVDNGGEVYYGEEGFDIQLVSDLSTKLLIQAVIKKEYPCGLNGPKSGRSAVWDLVLRVLQHLSITQS